MATRLGPAILPLALDTESARRDLDDLEKRYRRILGQRQEERKEDEKSTRQGREEVKQSRRTRQKMTTEARTGRFGPMVAKVAAFGAVAVGTALLFEKAATGITGAIAESVEGTPIAEQVAQAVDTATRDLSNRLSDLATTIGAVLPSAFAAHEILRAQQALGEHTSVQEIGEFFKPIYDANTQLKRAERQRMKIAAENTASIVGDLFRGGAQR